MTRKRKTNHISPDLRRLDSLPKETKQENKQDVDTSPADQLKQTTRSLDREEKIKNYQKKKDKLTNRNNFKHKKCIFKHNGSFQIGFHIYK